jgi:hypothetical protein
MPAGATSFLGVVRGSIRLHYAPDRGDSVTSPLWPRESLELLAAISAPTVRGNHDRWVAERPHAEKTAGSAPYSAMHRCTALVARRGRTGYTAGMKTAVSLPDALFRAADRHAKREGKSRSRLYADAIAEYLSRHAPDDVTAAMDRVVDQLPRERDPFVLAAARSVLARIEW